MSLAASGPSRRARDARVGLVLAALIVGGWVAGHVYGVFVHTWTPLGILLAPVLVLAQAWLGVGMFIVAHDAMHGTLAPGRPRLNAGIGGVCVALYAAFSYRRLLAHHMAHHRHAGTAEDPDFDADHPGSLGPWFVKFFRTYFGRTELAKVTLALAVYLALGASAANLILFWGVPALLSAAQLFVFGTYLPHRAGDDGFADRHNARSNDLGWLPSLLTCFHFGAFHHEHHLHPGVPWWRLPATRALLPAGGERSPPSLLPARGEKVARRAG